MNNWQNTPSNPLPPQSLRPATAANAPADQDPLSFLPPLGSTGSSLGNLADSERKKRLRNARGALILAGVLQLIEVGIAFVVVDDKQIEQGLRDEIHRQFGANVQINPVKFQEAKAMVLRVTRLVLVGFAAVGLVFFGLAALVLRYPAGATITGLIIYAGMHAILLVVTKQPMVLFEGIIWKVVIVVALVNGIKAGVALQKKKREDEEAQMRASFPPPPIQFGTGL